MSDYAVFVKGRARVFLAGYEEITSQIGEGSREVRSIEAISRGASHVTFVDGDRRAQSLIAENLRACGIETGYTMLRSTVERAWSMLLADPAFAPFDLILLDPPYDQAAAETLAGVDPLVAPEGWVVLEHARRIAAPDHAGRLTRTRDLRSGDSALAFYTCRH